VQGASLLGFLFEVSPFFDIGAYSYKVSSLFCLCCVPKVLVSCGFIFIRVSGLFDFSPLISSMTHWSFNDILLSLHLCEYFCSFFYCFLVLFCCGLVEYRGLFNFS
jgi:hypothetical protein